MKRTFKDSIFEDDLWSKVATKTQEKSLVEICMTILKEILDSPERVDIKEGYFFLLSKNNLAGCEEGLKVYPILSSNGLGFATENKRIVKIGRDETPEKLRKNLENLIKEHRMEPKRLQEIQNSLIYEIDPMPNLNMDID